MTWKSSLTLGCFSSLKKHIESPTAQRMARIIKRLLWFSFVMAATIGCLYTISDRIQFLMSGPTSTTISVAKRTIATFPAVTVCNLNDLKMSVLMERNLTGLLLPQFQMRYKINASEPCEGLLPHNQSHNLINITYEELIVQARQHVEDFIVRCYFDGEECDNVTKVFEPVFTNLGVCYTFNSGKLRPRLLSKGTGQRQGLQLMVLVNQKDYVKSADAGVKIAIHPQSEHPLPDDRGIGVPTGRNAFISIKEQNTTDRTGRDCKAEDDLSNFNFLKGQYTEYSESACLVDCIQTNIADNCECIGARSFHSPDTANYSQLPNCTQEAVCCVIKELLSPSGCSCPAACSTTSYETTVSYSYFPSDYFSDLIAYITGVSSDVFPLNLLQITAYFETLNVETLTTRSAYTFVALLSDIGGQLGLFLGLSVLSIMEYGNWIIKKIRVEILVQM